jgi:hypothetical protein
MAERYSEAFLLGEGQGSDYATNLADQREEKRMGGAYADGVVRRPVCPFAEGSKERIDWEAGFDSGWVSVVGR